MAVETVETHVEETGKLPYADAPENIRRTTPEDHDLVCKENCLLKLGSQRDEPDQIHWYFRELLTRRHYRSERASLPFGNKTAPRRVGGPLRRREDRLAIPTHGTSSQYLDLADLMSRIRGPTQRYTRYRRGRILGCTSGMQTTKKQKHRE